ncbi:MAG TPA: hypothetical protein VHM70_17725, partial [Polyangiaceae bacterium]|nr:hypothetical protein [Polyangiaceae bacterium]
GLELDPKSVSRALAHELDAEVADDPAHAAARFEVVARAGQTVTVTYLAQSGAPVSRSVLAPGRADEVPEVVALLAGNLARDDSGEILAQLEQDRKAKAAAAAQAAEAANAPKAEAPASVKAEPAKPKPPQPKDEPKLTAASDEKPLRDDWVNLSLFHPIALHPDAPQLRFKFELGLLYGRAGAIDGFGVDGVVLQVDQNSRAFLVGGLGVLERGPHTGMSVGGLFDIHTGQARSAFSVAGSVNYSSALEFRGAQIGGHVSIAAGKFQGLQTAGVLDYAHDLEGAQFSALLNLVPGEVNGVQISNLNIASTVKGAQLGLVNIGGDVKGLQLGLVNVAKKVEGASIGLVTYSQEGKVQLVSWVDTDRRLSMGARFYSKPLYAMPTLSYAPDARKHYEMGASIGGRIPLQRFYVDIDAGTVNAPNTDTLTLRYRTLLGFSVTPWFAVFAGGGARHVLHLGSSFSQDAAPEGSLGIELF